MGALNASQDDADKVRKQPALVSRYYDVVTRFLRIRLGIVLPLLAAATRRQSRP